MVRAYFENIRQTILTELDTAKEEIIVAVYWFTNQDLFNKLNEKLEVGVQVQLLIHNDYINNRETGLPFQSLIDKGGKVYFSNLYNPMHNKFCIVDKRVLINGSYNWTYYAENKNRENILVLKKEQKTIKAFHQEFDRLKKLAEQVNTIRPLSRFEIDENNILRTRDYLANDIIYQANSTNRRELVKTAFEISPENIEIQKIAHYLNLTKKYILKHSIGSSLINDGYRVIVQKGSSIPSSFSTIVRTTQDNQTETSADICYGENNIASKNVKFAEMNLTGLPPKPAGKAEIKYHFTIDIYGNMRMEKYSLDNGRKQIISRNISGLLKEIK